MVSKLIKTPRSGNKQSKKKCKKLETKKNTGLRLTVSDEQGTGTPERSTVSQFVDALCKVHNQKKNVNNKLFEEDGNGVHLQVAGIKLPKDNRNQLIRCVLPHCAVPDPVDICLFVKDLQKGLNVDHEPTLEHFNSILEEKDAKCLIGQVISLRELKVEYKPYEAKRLLSNKFDVFLADARIIRLLSKFLGKAFYSRKRFPVQVDLNKRNLREELEKAIRTVTLPLSHHGTTATLRVGHIGMKREELVDNVMHAITLLSKRYPGGWKNVRSLHVKTETSMAIPIHVCATSVNDVGFVDSDAPIKIKQRTVTGEFSLIPGAEVTVTPAGRVMVKRTMDSTWNEVEVQDDEPFVDGSDIEGDETKAEGGGDERTKKRSHKGESKTTESSKKKKRNIKNREQDSSDSEDDIRNREMSYLRSAQREEWQDGKSGELETTKEEEEPEVDSDEVEESREDGDAEDCDMGDAEADSDEEQEGSDDIPESNEGAKDSNSEQESSEGDYDDQQPLDDKDVVVDSDDDGSEVEIDSLMFQPAPDSVQESEAKTKNPRTNKKTKNERRKDRNKQKAGDNARTKRTGVGKSTVHAVPTKKRNRKKNM